MQIKFKNILVISILCFAPLLASAQQVFNMAGVVTDKDGPLVGVNIFLKNRTDVGTVSDSDGAFKIKASKGEIIVFSYIGYENTEYRVEKEDNKIQIKMNPAQSQLDEVVVTALGTQRKVSVVGAITSVDVAQLQTPATSISNMLGGRVAGIITQLSSGEPGKNISEFWVRGIGTFGANSSALVLIDGLEGDLNSVDPADVESFSVLKDASATAVYGVRGANGVVLINTKRGASEKLRITGRANFALSHLQRMPKYLRAYDYALMANEAREVRGEQILYDNMELKLIQNHLDADLYPDIDWQTETVKPNSFQQTYYMSAQGGGEKATYFASLGASIEDAAYKVAPENIIRSGVGYNTYNYRLNLDINLTKNTKMTFGTNGFQSRQTQPGMTNTDDIWAAQSMLTPITVPIRYSTGELPAYSASFGQAGISPYVLLNYTGKSTNEHYIASANLALVHEFDYLLKNLKLRVQGAFDTETWHNESRYSLPDLYLASGRTIWGELQRARTWDAVSASYIYYQRQYQKYQLQSTLTWNKVIDDKHRTDVLIFYEMNNRTDTYDVDNAGSTGRSLAALPKRYQALASKLEYGFSDTYMIAFNFGYTGSENFQPGRQFGFFPSVAAGWVPTQYEWVKNHLPWLNFLKIRGSYGTAGNDQIADYRFPFLTIVQENQPLGWGASFPRGGVSEVQFGANNLVWERSTKSNVGLDARMLKDRLQFTVDVFNDKRDNIFQRRETIPGYIGLIYSARPFGNVGRMHSYGSDGNISFTQPVNEKLSFTLRGNYTFSQNEILNWEQAPTRYPYQLLNGYPYGAIRGYIAQGLFKDENDVAYSAVQSFGGFKVQPGDIKYKDVNGDGVINSDDQVFLSDPTYPRLMYGFGGEVKYRNLTLGVLFKGTGRTDFFHVGYSDAYGTNGPGYVPFNNGKVGNVLTIAQDPSSRWIPMDYALAHGIDPSKAENPNALFPRLTYGYNANNSQLSTFWKDDARYLRLQELTLNYNLKTKLLQKLGLSSTDIQFVGNNLYIWDKVKNWDPEQGYRNGRAYPIPARYAVQIYLNF